MKSYITTATIKGRAPVGCFTFATKMAAAGSVPVVLRVVSASVSIAHRAGQIIRDIMKKGELGIVEKVRLMFLLPINNFMHDNRSS